MLKPITHIIIKIQTKTLFLLFCLLMISGVSLSQNNGLNQRISIDLKNLSLENALDSIAKKTNTYFTYDASILIGKPRVNLVAKNEMLKLVLRQIIPDTTLNFQLINKQIIIVPTSLRENITRKILKPQLNTKKISGRILDKRNKKALAYASIGIRGKTIGTISNVDGEFLLNIQAEHFNDTLVISFIGLKNTEIPLAQLSTDDIRIELEEDYISLQEVIIRNTDPLALLKSVINNFSKNYPEHPSLLTAFYRESVSKNKNYMIYLESILDIYKSSYQSYNRIDMAKIFQSRKIYDSSRLDTVSLRLKGGVEGCLQLDIVKNKIDFLNLENLSFYYFQMDGISSFNNHPVYIIQFQPKPDLSELLMQGTLYIDTRSLAIIRAEFSYPLKRINETKNHFIAQKSSKTKVRPLKIEYDVSYKNINGKYYLNHTKGNLKFKVRHKRNFFSKTFETCFEMAITQVDTNNVERFKYKERLRPNTVLSKSRLPYDSEFWGSQNYIEPEESIQHALERINANMQQVAKKDD
ncbi:carboxypeptidase-like regulatory domain-containing protein [Ancylomarina salipaludis]|uniref:Carboxypeptidase-like regulatory domain-containing protein n=1 Tax=Ancylomarina salipaludis TaxID=2501299 RepID=A0A4Q1JJP2_9BACT|nr:carboxypeptidase-like regulatory domain-containing protein [Ancylomarina salipaludis]RXQ91560.1 carboxypeptidase-like regulatory domain-containing protein [Ancylomarina salipaludis]